MSDKPQGVPLFCCELAKICMLTNRPIEHAKDCPTNTAVWEKPIPHPSLPEPGGDK